MSLSKPLSLSLIPTSDTSVSKFNQSKFIALAKRMIDSGKIKTDLEFARKFMFAFDEHEEKFCISLEHLIELKIYDRKDHAKTKLIKNFQKEIDYQIGGSFPSIAENEKSPHERSGRNKETIMLTVDCFKEMCTLSQNDYGRQVRRYYLDLEQISKTCIEEEFQKQLQEQLEEFQEQIEDKDNDILKLKKTHAKFLERQNYFKLSRKGACFYIIVSGLEYVGGKIIIKFGIAGCPKRNLKCCPHCKKDLEDIKQTKSIDNRLANHRTLWPQLQVKFLVYTNDAVMLEKCIKRVYHNNINPNGHELIENVPLSRVIETVQGFLNSFNVFDKDPAYLIEDKLNLYNDAALIPIKEDINRIEEKLDIVLHNQEHISEQKEDIEEKVNLILHNQEHISEQKEQIEEKVDLILHNQEHVIQEQNEELDQKDEKISDLEDKLGEYNKILGEMSGYMLTQVKNTLSKYGQTKQGSKEELKHKLKTYIETCIQNLTSPPPEIIPSTTKECVSCHEVKNNDEFCRDSTRKDELACYCKPCKRDKCKSYSTKDKIERSEKECKKCNKTLPIDQFHDKSDTTDGKQSYCRDCISQAKVVSKQSNKVLFQCQYPLCGSLYELKDSVKRHWNTNHRDSIYNHEKVIKITK